MNGDPQEPVNCRISSLNIQKRNRNASVTERVRDEDGQKRDGMRELSGGEVVAKYITSRRIKGDLWTRLATCIYQASNQQWLFQLARGWSGHADSAALLHVLATATYYRR